MTQQPSYCERCGQPLPQKVVAPDFTGRVSDIDPLWLSHGLRRPSPPIGQSVHEPAGKTQSQGDTGDNGGGDSEQIDAADDRTAEAADYV